MVSICEENKVSGVDASTAAASAATSSAGVTSITPTRAARSPSISATRPAYSTPTPSSRPPLVARATAPAPTPAARPPPVAPATAPAPRNQDKHQLQLHQLQTGHNGLHPQLFQDQHQGLPSHLTSVLDY